MVSASERERERERSQRVLILSPEILKILLSLLSSGVRAKSVSKMALLMQVLKTFGINWKCLVFMQVFHSGFKK